MLPKIIITTSSLVVMIFLFCCIQFARLLSEKKAAYSEYKKIKKEIRYYQIAKQNVESFYAAQQSWDIEEDMKKKRQQSR